MITAMLSSTVHDLPAERDAVHKALEELGIFRTVGVNPANQAALAASPYTECIRLAKECDVYILILGGEYGWIPTGKTKSATEIEYNCALETDPTKVLVFRKNVPNIEPQQGLFIDRVQDYFSGYWTVPFSYSHELHQLVQTSIKSWLKERVAQSPNLSYVEHFLRLAVSNRPLELSNFRYEATTDKIYIGGEIRGTTCVIEFNTHQLINEFWRSYAELLDKYEEWRKI